MACRLQLPSLLGGDAHLPPVEDMVFPSSDDADTLVKIYCKSELLIALLFAVLTRDDPRSCGSGLYSVDVLSDRG